MTALVATISALCSIITTLAATWAKVRPALVPLLRRRRFPVAVVASEAHDAAARALVTDLRSSGFREVELTRDASSCLGRRAVVLWRPAPDAAPDLVARAQGIAPEATVLVLTTERLDVRLGDRLLLANSPLRLRGDLGVLAESAA
jgi:hypothetical protein